MAQGVAPVFKRDTAYMEVPRCDACQLWEKDSGRVHFGSCLLFTGGPTDYGAIPELLAFSAGPDGTRVYTKASFGCVQFLPRVKP